MIIAFQEYNLSIIENIIKARFIHMFIVINNT